MRALSLALRSLAREWRSGELGVLLLALTVAVAALTGVGFLVSRISTAVALQASEVLAADIRLGSPQTIRRAVFRRSEAPRPFDGEQHRFTERRFQRRTQPADQSARRHTRISPTRAGADCRRAICCGTASAGHSAAGRSLAGLKAAVRDRRAHRLGALHWRGNLSCRPRAHLPTRSERNVCGACAELC